MACLIALAVSVFLSERAFQQVLDFRELERIPLSHIDESIDGEVQLRGRALQDDAIL